MTDVQQASSSFVAMSVGDLDSMTQVPPSDSPTDVSLDAVSSLRAAALSSLRMKRKKTSSIAPKATIASRPHIPQNSLTLDYGTDEQSTPARPTIPEKKEPKEPPAVQQTEEPSSVEDTKEEGEISEEEEPPALRDTTPPNGHSPGKALSNDKAQKLSTEIPSETSANSKAEKGHRDTSHHHQHPLIDEYHVRPGLTMSIEQLNMVKELVLDLLGWGVAPEYLVECGLTRHAIFYAFTELNLKLPKNLDTTGIDPFPFPRPSLSFMKPDSSGSGQDSTLDRSSKGHPLPAKPVTASSSTSALTNDRQYHPLSSSSEQALLDIEAQKRQELLARRAVLASRKKMSPMTHPNSTTPVSRETTPEQPKVVPFENVDDFLNSMLSDTSLPPPKLRSRGGEIGPPRVEDHESMDVDLHETLGKGNTSISLSADAPIFRPASSISISVATTSDVPSQNQASTSKSAKADLVDVQVAPGSSVPPGPLSGPFVPSRRGTKRPVASDFVDVDAQPNSLSRSPSVSSVAPPPHARRKVGGFAGLSGHVARRCVIDLSDSEDGEDDPGGGDPELCPPSRASVPIRSPRPVRPLPASSSKPTPSVLSPGDLMEKENQIQRMKEAIARREQERLKKLDTITRSQKTSTPVPDDVVLADSSSASTPATIHTLANTVSESTSEQDLGMQTRLHEETTEDVYSADDLQEVFRPDTLNPVDATEDGTASEPQLLTSEADQEQLVNSVMDDAGTDDEISSGENDVQYSAYDSLLFSYPLLRSRARFKADIIGTSKESRSVECLPADFSHPESSSHTDKLTIPDLRPLRNIVMLRQAGTSLDRYLCRYELGGGTCYDETCGDLHVSKLEPSDKDIAHYLIDSMGKRLAMFSEGAIVDRLLQARQRNKSNLQTTTEEIVADALSLLSGIGSQQHGENFGRPT